MSLDAQGREAQRLPSRAVRLKRPLVGAALGAALTCLAPPAQADEAASIFDPTTVVEIELHLPEASREALASDPGEYVDATFSLTGPTASYGPLAIGARLKGTTSFRPLSRKAAFKLKFSHSVPGQRLLGLKTLTLNNMVQDSSMVHELLAYEVFRAVGIAAPRAGYAYVRVNGEDYGVYLNVETPDDVFLPRWFSSTGHLYEGESADVDPGAAGSFQVDEGSESDLSDLERLIAVVNGPAEGWSARMAPVADLNQMTRMWAVEKYVGHWDGYAGNRNNFYLHSDAAGRFSMLPWGTDQTWFRRLPLGREGARGRMFIACLADPSCEAMYRAALDDVRTTVIGLDLEQRVTNVAEMLEPWQLIDPRREYSIPQIRAAVAGVLGFLRARPGDIRRDPPFVAGSDRLPTAPSPTQSASPPIFLRSLGEWARSTVDRMRTLVRRQGFRRLANGFSHMLGSDRPGIAIEDVLAPANRRRSSAGARAARRVVVARGFRRFRGPGRGRIYVRPTRAARHMLRGSKPLELVMRMTFDPAGSEGPTRRASRVTVSPRGRRSGRAPGSATYIGCGIIGANGLVTTEPRLRPRSCSPLADASGIDLRRLRWRAWGSRSARGRGRVLGSQRNGQASHIPVRVHAYRRVRVFDNDLCYTRLRVAAGGTVSRVRLRGCL